MVLLIIYLGDSMKISDNIEKNLEIIKEAFGNSS